MLKRDVSKLVLLEMLFGLAPVILVVGFAVSRGADAGRFAIKDGRRTGRPGLLLGHPQEKTRGSQAAGILVP